MTSLHRFLSVITVALAIGFSSTAQAYELSDYGLIHEDHLPHLMKTIMKHRGDLELTREQKQALKQLRQTVPMTVHPLLSESKKLEIAIAHQVMREGATKEQLSAQLTQLQSSKREATEALIEALNQVRNILTPEQYETVLDKADWPE